PRDAGCVQKFADRVIHRPRCCPCPTDARALRAMNEFARCPWATTELMIGYHDREWGVPLHDDRALFELLILEGAQAGLSWSTILNKRENYRRAFGAFDFETVSRYGEADVERLLGDPGIVRNRLKIGAAIDNARGVV